MVTTLDFVTENTLRVTLSQKDDAIILLKAGNMVIASFVTSYACLHLFEHVEHVERVDKRARDELVNCRILFPLVPKVIHVKEFSLKGDAKKKINSV